MYHGEYLWPDVVVAGRRCKTKTAGLTVVPGETVAVGREAGVAQDRDLGQVDTHDGQVSGHRHDSEDAPCSKTKSLEDMDTAQNDCRVGERYEAL